MNVDTKPQDGTGIGPDKLPLDPCTDINPAGWPGAVIQDGPAEEPDTGAGHDSGLDQAESEPKQGTGEKPEDWTPPAGNPGSDQDALTDRDRGGA